MEAAGARVDGMDTGDEKTLLERMGGASTVIDTIEGLHARMAEDNDLSRFIEGVDPEVWTGKLFDFLGRMLGASEYDGGRLRRAHQRLVDGGLDDSHFDATLDYLRAAMVQAGVPDSCLDEVITAFESTRSDVLCI